MKHRTLLFAAIPLGVFSCTPADISKERCHKCPEQVCSIYTPDR